MLDPSPKLGAAALTALFMAAASPSHAETITPIAEAARGAAVTVQGAVARVLDYDEIRIADSSGAIVVYLGPDAPAIAAGEQLTIRGRVDDGWLRELYAREIVRANGDTIALRRDY
jgi:uncharacterized protein YdeI (BOF family)